MGRVFLHLAPLLRGEVAGILRAGEGLLSTCATFIVLSRSPGDIAIALSPTPPRKRVEVKVASL